MAGEATLDNVRTPRVRVAPKLAKAKLVERRDITPDLFIIKLEPEEGPLRFKAGQYCTLGLKGIERAYSIVSAPRVEANPPSKTGMTVRLVEPIRRR